jgi:hypothetical protein
MESDKKSSIVSFFITKAGFVPAKVAQTLLLTKFRELKLVMPCDLSAKLSVFDSA